MAKSKKSSVPGQGLQNIRTHSTMGGNGAKDSRYMLFMRISCLEMERARRKQEHDAAMKRVHQIEARFEEIDEEVGHLMNKLPVTPAQPGASAPYLPGSGRTPLSGMAAMTLEDVVVRQSSKGFKIKY